MTLRPDTALVFPGQGSQRQGMLDPVPVDDLPRLLDAAEAMTGLPLREIAATGSAQDLADTRASQPLLYLADCAWGMEVLRHRADPCAVAGHSLGEFAALAVADVFSVEAGLSLVVERSRLMAEAVQATSGGMAAVLGMERSLVIDLVEGIDGVWVANDNSPAQVVISGTGAGMETATRELSEAGARKIVPLKVAGAFHCPLMASAGEAFARVLAGAEFSDALVPVVQNTSAEPATDAKVIRERLASQMTSPVRWTETMASMRSMGVTRLVECGPGSVLKGLARGIEGLTAVSVEEVGVQGAFEEV